ncbi:LPO_1073/Vpar_1526 family protein [Rhizobium sp. N324]|uniref:LPO_1073/Vpar_1526 family protein n=1 Tax=Rhizobium sp. N324 TaxID=1703969 RepID=UPI0007EC188F|nr:LPO_1073/Vpar_1526 family protein [Rhizobium sp. N324]ANM12020.1 hypothetical protein AMK05_CH03671 [Rhizobium sp. N324]
MTDKQNVKAGDDAQVVVSGRDTHIGVPAAEVFEYMSKLHEVHIDHFVARAGEIAESRCRIFEERILRAFVDGGAGNPSAFQDPDFQYHVLRARNAFARSGDEELGEILISMISTRSNQNGRDRVTLSLNEAIERSGLLTSEDFAVITLCFLMRYCRSPVTSIEELGRHFRNLTPFASEIQTERASCQYIESLGLGSIGMPSDFTALVRSFYMPVISTGFNLEQIDPVVREEYPALITEIIEPCKLDPAKHQLNFSNLIDLIVYLGQRGWNNDEQVTALWNLFESTALVPLELQAKLKPHAPDIQNLFGNWQLSDICRLHLTSVGMAIGHANAKRLGIPIGPISIWIK